jgi:protein-tyrosine phosphatase
VIDLHTHILPGIDDGARTLADAIAMAEAALADGVGAVAATPHVRDDYPTSASTMQSRLGEVRAALDRAGLPLRVLSGGELALDRLDLLPDEELRRFGLGGNQGVLLLEMPYSGWPLELLSRVLELRDRGIRAVLAHPERNPEVQATGERLRAAVNAGALVQITGASLDGRLGRKARAAARSLLDASLVHMLASDAHMPEVRGIGLSAAALAVGDERLARWLTEEIPAALLAGEALPARPQRARSRFGLFRR